MLEQIQRALGARLRAARLRSKLTQEAVAADFLLSRQAISAWETGKAAPSLLQFKDLASLYGVSADQILFGIRDVASECQAVIARARSKDADFAASGFHDTD